MAAGHTGRRRHTGRRWQPRPSTAAISGRHRNHARIPRKIPASKLRINIIKKIGGGIFFQIRINKQDSYHAALFSSEISNKILLIKQFITKFSRISSEPKKKKKIRIFVGGKRSVASRHSSILRSSVQQREAAEGRRRGRRSSSGSGQPQHTNLRHKQGRTSVTVMCTACVWVSTDENNEPLIPHTSRWPTEREGRNEGRKEGKKEGRKEGKKQRTAKSSHWRTNCNQSAPSYQTTICSKRRGELHIHTHAFRAKKKEKTLQLTALEPEAGIVWNTKGGIVCQTCIYFSRFAQKKIQRANIIFVGWGWGDGRRVEVGEMARGLVGQEKGGLSRWWVKGGSNFLIPGLCLNLVKWDDRSLKCRVVIASV